MVWIESDVDHLIVSSSQMKGIENRLFSFGMPIEALMEKVGLEMKDWLIKKPNLLSNGVLVLVGPGHNGGDGLVLARELHLMGIEVCLWCPFPIKKSLTNNHLSYCISLGIRKLNSDPDPTSKTLWIDALFGLGQKKAINKDIALLFEKRERVRPSNLISLDVPSGLCSDTGLPLSDKGAATASFTLTVGLVKRGLIQDAALPYVGKIIRIDIGIPAQAMNSLPKQVPLMLSSEDIKFFNFPKTPLNATKYERGRTLVVAGSNQYLGASLLALKGAIASGIGSIHAVLPKSISNNLWTKVPEVVFHDCFYDFQKEEISLSKSFLDIELDHFESLLIGPGLGLKGEAWNEFSSFLKGFRGLLVLDADALNRLSLSSESWRWFLTRKSPTLITPNMNEFRRLFPEIDSSCPLNAAQLASFQSGTFVLLKGAHSVLASPEGSVRQLVSSSHLSARAGLGDVLAGFLAGIGSLGLSSVNKKIDIELLSFAVLIHAVGAMICKEGSNASLVSKTLTKFVKEHQQGKVHIDTL